VPVETVSLSNARTYTMRELSQRTAQVIDEINDNGRPSLLTKHGRIVALVTPLRDADVESIVLSRGPLADELQSRINEDSELMTYSTEEVTERIQKHQFEDD